MRYLSVCSGIEAATVAWHGLGWTPVAFSEIEPFPSAVLKHHYPDVPNVGDMTKFKEWNLGPIDLLVGGTPCQSFSVAGLRNGLDDPRGNLMLTFLAIAERHRPRWIVWENVPGVLSSNGGRDFGTFLGALGELGYGWAYRVLDAQWFGVAQRRRRVFVVGCLGDQASAAAVLFESESVCRNPAPSREKGQGAARGVGGGPADGSISGAVTRKWAKGSGGPAGDECYNMVAQPVAYGIDEEQNASRELFGCLKARTAGGGFEGTVAQPVAFEPGSIARNAGPAGESDLAPTLRREMGDNQPAVRIAMQVRRLTPTECERLQGFPDGWTAIPIVKPQPIKGQPAVVKAAADGPRYKALGNSMAVPCMKWIGERIAARVEALVRRYQQ